VLHRSIPGWPFSTASKGYNVTVLCSILVWLHPVFLGATVPLPHPRGQSLSPKSVHRFSGIWEWLGGKSRVLRPVFCSLATHRCLQCCWNGTKTLLCTDSGRTYLFLRVSPRSPLSSELKGCAASYPHTES